MRLLSLYNCKKIVLFLIGFSLSFSRYLLYLFRYPSFFFPFILFCCCCCCWGIDVIHCSFQGNGISMKISDQNVEEECDLKREGEKNGFWDSSSSNRVEERFDSCFTFKFPAFDEFIKNQTEKDEFFCSDFVCTPASRYEFTCTQSVGRFVEQKHVVNLGVKHINGDSLVIEHNNGSSDKTDNSVPSHLNVEMGSLVHEAFLARRRSVEGSRHKGVLGARLPLPIDKRPLPGLEASHLNIEIPEKYGNFQRKNQECCYLPVDENDSLGGHTVKPHWNGFLSDGDFDQESKDLNHEKSNNTEDKGLPNSDFLREERFQEDVAKDSCDYGDENKLECLWEHQELIEQLKMELKKVKASGLPTILEESESNSSTKIIQDLKPWKIDETFQHEDCMDELHMLYKSYTERMRKLDVFNYQKMYAIGFLELKDPFQSIPRPKTPTQILKSMLSEKLIRQKHNKSDKIDPMEKFMKEIQSDLEVVYVGQMCLSWELLHWQYRKALDLWESDPRGIRVYNEVAGEFQQFQVLLQRFLEDETFQGPRVRFYIKNRCVNRNLLQVPLIREDRYRNRRNKKKNKTSEDVITSYQLVEMIEESIRIFWQFIRADKDTCSLIVPKGSSHIQQLQNQNADLELLKDIRNLLLKKERKLKELRSGKWIWRRLRACREEEESDKVLYNFFSLVDIKLVTRGVNMMKITNEQLVWCHTKLENIKFEATTTTRSMLHVDSPFLPFLVLYK